ncbi:MAG: ABC transporter permease, partial [Bacteroidetes bacterium]|nr:ABC transporter permease [Bacteroidota bacterium]
MNVSFYIAKRYLFSKSKNNAINYMTIIAAIGVVVGSAALLVVLSGFAGLKDFSLQFSSIVDPDLKITPRTGKTIRLKSNTLAQINEINSVVSYSKIVEERAVLVSDNKRQIITLKGVDSLYPQNTI